MKRHFLAYLLPLIILFGCNTETADEAPAPSNHASKDQGTFDHERWATLVSTHPCEWWPVSRLEKEYFVSLQFLAEHTKTQKTCVWQNETGATILRATLHTWDTPDALNNEKDGQFGQISSDTGFFEVIASSGTATAILRKARSQVFIFANAENEVISITLKGMSGRQSTAEERQKDIMRLTHLASGLM